MGSDRARVTYDPRQQYRSVVMQQGRVTLEADWNEAQQIFAEEMRKEALDFVGPSGTPDNGYAIVPGQQPTHAPYDFSVQPGVMYVGGVRVELHDAVQYSNQPDWLDRGPEDPDWLDLAAVAAGRPKDEFVYLLLREQEVSAVEDPDLKDVALGGPDTAQRTRLLQRFPRVVCNGSTCDAGLAAAEAKWQTEGLVFHPDNMRLTSEASLQVHFSGQSQTDPCQPSAQGGYLAPDNQLIRVQISGIDSLTGRPKFLWGFDDASFLYRIDIDPNNPQSLILQSPPPDAAHQPVAGQAVEILRAAAELSNGGFVAALSGFAVTLDQAYDPDSQSIALPAGVSLPDDYLASTMSPPAPLFLRVWQQEVVFTPGNSAVLGNTGLQVTLWPGPLGVFHLGDYWMFAVRPATPQVVYPERCQASAQPPDGPRLWACPLGVIGWLRTIGTLAADCRNTFCTLVDACKKQQGCCTYTVGPQDLTGGATLQSVINKASRPTMLVQAAFAGAAGNNITVEISNLQPGATPPTFDLTVTETDIYQGVTVVGLPSTIGTESSGPNTGLAHVIANSVNAKLTPLNNQTVVFSGGQASAGAQANVRDSSNQTTAFILAARAPGTDGNVTQATISNVSGTTFDLSVTWQRKLPALNLATVFAAVQASLGYVIVASPPTTTAAALPSAGFTRLSGGADANPTAATSAATAQGAIFGNPATICLRPGVYSLPAPLTFGPEQSNITLEACATATLAADPQQSKNFAQGLIQITGAANITLRGITFALPRVTLSQTGLNLANLSANSLASIGEQVLLSLDAAIGMMVTGASGLDVQDCVFHYPQLLPNELLYAVGIFAGADCSAVTLKRNLFEGPAALSSLSTATTVNSGALSAGYLQSDTLQTLSLGGDGTILAGGTLVPSSLDNLVVEENSFSNLAFPMLILTALGAALFEANVVRSSLSGFTMLPLLASVAGANQAFSSDARTQVLQNAAAQRMASIAIAYPRPASFVPSRQLVVTTVPSGPPPPPLPSGGGRTAVAILPLALTPSAPAAPTGAAPVSAQTLAAAPIVAVPITPIVPAPTAATPTAPAPTPTPAPPTPAPPTPVPPTPAPPTPAPPLPVGLPVLNLPTLSPLAVRVANLISSLAVSAIGIIQFQRNLNFSVQLANNDIEALAGVSNLWALSVLDLASLSGAAGTTSETTLGAVTLTGNKLRTSSTSTLFSTASLMAQFAAVAGNVIMNQGKGGGSLAVVVPNAAGANTANAAITGNVLMGPSNLPPRSPASLPDWTTYNCML